MGRTIFITGSNRGIGEAILREFCKEDGVTILAHARKLTESFKAMIDELNISSHGKIVPICFDLNDTEALDHSMRDVLKTYVRVDVLVNNAGIMPRGKSFLMTDIHTMWETFQVNFFSHVKITQMIAKAMIRNGGGAIVSMSSIAVKDGSAGQFEYTCSKAAIEGMTIRLAHELAPYSIRCNAVAPGLVATDMMGYLGAEELDMLGKKPYLKRFGLPQEVATTVVFLASKNAAYINGQIIHIDGGLGRFS